jgi:hypothetical protein
VRARINVASPDQTRRSAETSSTARLDIRT